MKRQTRFWIAAALLLAAAGAASAGGVTVKYQEPERFSDVPLWEQDRNAVLKELTAHFQHLAKQLPANQQLTVTVTDLDLAGRVEPRRRTIQDIRVLRGQADWPTMELQYTLEQDGKVIASGTDRLSNMAYLDHFNRYADSDTLRYEKPMVDEWFKKNFGMPTQMSRK